MLDTLLEQDQEVTKVLFTVKPQEKPQTLRTESVQAIRQMLSCQSDRATAILKSLEQRRIIEARSIPRGQITQQELMPMMLWHWERMTDFE